MKRTILFLLISVFMLSCKQNFCKNNECCKSKKDDKCNVALVFDKDTQSSFKPQSAIDFLKQGNMRYVDNLENKKDFVESRNKLTEGQHPLAFVLSCIDSRVPVEYIFDLNIGDVFTGRVAGNIVDRAMVGSMEYACRVAGAKLIVVMGHSKCGAVASAIKGVEMGNITHLLGKIKPSVERTEYKGERKSENSDFLNEVIKTNIQTTIDRIRELSPIIKEMEKNDSIKIVGAVYDIKTGKVEFL